MAFLLGRMAGVMKGIMPRTSNMDMVVWFGQKPLRKC
jgi:hypothetical protein